MFHLVYPVLFTRWKPAPHVCVLAGMDPAGSSPKSCCSYCTLWFLTGNVKITSQVNAGFFYSSAEQREKLVEHETQCTWRSLKWKKFVGVAFCFSVFRNMILNFLGRIRILISTFVTLKQSQTCLKFKVCNKMNMQYVPCTQQAQFGQ